MCKTLMQTLPVLLLNRKNESAV